MQKHQEVCGNIASIYQLYVNNNNAIVDFVDNNPTDSFTFKVKITGEPGNHGTKDLEIMVPLKYLSNFWRTLEMPLINCEINLILTWSVNCVIISTNNANQNATKIYW